MSDDVVITPEHAKLMRETGLGAGIKPAPMQIQSKSRNKRSEGTPASRHNHKEVHMTAASQTTNAAPATSTPPPEAGKTEVLYLTAPDVHVPPTAVTINTDLVQAKALADGIAKLNARFEASDSIGNKAIDAAIIFTAVAAGGTLAGFVVYKIATRNVGAP